MKKQALSLVHLLFLTLFLLVLGASPARAQHVVEGLSVLTRPAGVRALGLGGLYASAGAVGSDAVFYNPALLTAARGLGLSAGRYASGSMDGVFSAAQSFGSSGVAIGVSYLDLAGEVRAPGNPDLLEVSVPERRSLRSSLLAMFGYGRTVKGVRLGVAGKVFEERAGWERGTGGAVDVGAAFSFAGATISLAAQNLGPEVELAEVRAPLPRRVLLSAASTSMPVGPLDLVPVAGVVVERDGFVAPAAGVELAYWPVQGRTFVGRLGLRRTPDGGGSPLTAGGGFVGDRFAVDYAYERSPDGRLIVSGQVAEVGGGDIHRVGLRWWP
jgi:hypothetical protein